MHRKKRARAALWLPLVVGSWSDRLQTSIVGPNAVLEADCTLEAEAIIGAGVTIGRGSHLAGDRVPS